MVDEAENSKHCYTIITKVIVMVISISHVTGFAEKVDDVIYVLMWQPIEVKPMPFQVMQLGRAAFIIRNCTFHNCYVTDDRSFFFDILDFDVIIFNLLFIKNNMDIPHKRSQNQKYVLAALEPSGLIQVPVKFNNFFNLTWTYKLDSDIVFPYIVVKNERNEKIGPKIDMHWMDINEMNETSEYIKNKLHRKRVAAAWFVTNCNAPNARLAVVNEIQRELANYAQRVDVYGECGDGSNYCPYKSEECDALIESTYYFYLAFENSFCEDYVSEKILTGLEHFAVPVVFGGANYTRFMPDGIYLDARTLGPAKLAREMIDIIYNKKRYYDFFKWHGYYSFHNPGEDNYHNEICGLCDLLNNKTAMDLKTVRRTNLWWNEWYNGIPDPTMGNLELILDEEKPAATGVAGLVSDVYNKQSDDTLMRPIHESFDKKSSSRPSQSHSDTNRMNFYMKDETFSNVI